MQEFFKRSPERQKDYERALELFAQGKVASEVARLLNLPWKVANYWSSELKRKKRDRREKILSELPSLKTPQEVAIAQLPEVAIPIVNSRNKIEGIYYKSIDSLDKTITKIYKIICDGFTEERDPQTGETVQIPLSMSEYKELIQTLSLCTKEFTSLNLLPYGAQSPSGSVKAEKTQSSQQHIHFHGGQSTLPKKAKKSIEATQIAETIAVLDAEPVSIAVSENESEVLDEL